MNHVMRKGLGTLLVFAALFGFSGCGSNSAHATAKGLGSYPAYLPKNTLNYKTDQVLDGSVDHPALTMEGDPVHVVTPQWSAEVTVSGPTVPGEGLPYQPESVTCTWTVTIDHATAGIPLSTDQFTSIDHLGHVYAMEKIKGEQEPPASVKPGQKVSFELRAFEAVGEGLMRWSPDTKHILAKWDYTVEND